MYAKEKMLVKLKNKGLNIFDYKVMTTATDLVLYHRLHKNFTIRFTKVDDCKNLPFYVVNESVDSDKVAHIGFEAEYLHCAMIVSDGIKYENNQVLNFVFCKKPNGDFIIEYHIGSEPLRQMYNYPTTVIKGNLYTQKEDWTFRGSQRIIIGFSDLEYLLNYIDKVDIYNKYVECTLYDCKVGINLERVITWGY